MAINFVRKKKKEKYLVIALVVAIPIIIFIFWYGFLRKEKPSIDRTTLPRESFSRVNINFQVLEDPILQELTSFPELPYFPSAEEGNLGRNEPFLPYYSTGGVEE